MLPEQASYKGSRLFIGGTGTRRDALARARVSQHNLTVVGLDAGLCPVQVEWACLRRTIAHGALRPNKGIGHCSCKGLVTSRKLALLSSQPQ